MRAYRVAEVRAAEDAELAVTAAGALMQTAAAALAAGCARKLRQTGKVTGRRVVLLVGAGNNGGDALWAGARLAGRGAQVLAVTTGVPVHPAGAAALRAAGGTLTDDPVVGAAALRRAELVVDGLVGLGGRPGLRPAAAELVAAIGDEAVVVSVDLPSGVDPDTGELPGAHVRADLTITFGAAKPCLLLPPASVAAGRVEVVELGFAARLGPALVERLGGTEVARLWPVPAAGADKYRRGVLGVVAGSDGYPGAAVLAVAGAQRAGVGMVRYLGPRQATAAVLAAWPEVVAGTGRVQAWVLGPGVSPVAEDEQAATIRAALAGEEPCLLDAGALPALVRRLIRERDERIDGSVPDRSARWLLTPHAGELARLLTDLGAEPSAGVVDRAAVERQPYRYACLAARLTGATVLLKGSTTVVVQPDGRARSQTGAPSWLATAGAGDVLAGIAGALLAGGLSPFDAGAMAALVHGSAATAASAGGPIVAGDVAEHLPTTIADLLTC